MNAAEKATNFEVAGKIAAIVNLFKAEFPPIRADLKPWMNDRETLDLVDPDSIDIGFHFPGYSRSFQSRSILIQIRFHEDPLVKTYRAVGIEAIGFTHAGKQWRFSTIENWDFVGETCPGDEGRDRLKYLCRSIMEIFNGSELASGTNG
ncbi:MAG: hypothetical protein ACTS2F_06175 [Thainema sp.]